jgi:hypothetical protein
MTESSSVVHMSNLYNPRGTAADALTYLADRSGLTDISVALARVKSDAAARVLYDALISHEQFVEGVRCTRMLVAIACSDLLPAVDAARLLATWQSVGYQVFQTVETSSHFADVKLIAEAQWRSRFRQQCEPVASKVSANG